MTLKIRSKAHFKNKSQNIWQHWDNSVFPYSNANDMRVTQDLNSFGEIIAHAHCSVDEKMSDASKNIFRKNNCTKKKMVHTTWNRQIPQ